MLSLFTSPRFADHLTPPGHPERVDRHVVMQVVAAEFGQRGGGVLEEVAELGGVVVPDGRGEAYGTLADLLQPLDLGHENAKLERDLLLRRHPPKAEADGGAGALADGAVQAPAYEALTGAIKAGSRLAIWLSTRF